jgi:hypothetical protein
MITLSDDDSIEESDVYIDQIDVLEILLKNAGFNVKY